MTKLTVQLPDWLHKSVQALADRDGYSIDQYNRALITADMEKRLQQARAEIVAGKIKVTDYMAK